MILTPLGISAAYSTGPYGYTCNLIDKKILVDVGPQAMTALNKLNLKVDSLDALVITHFDADHILGFPLLIPARTPEVGPLPVYGPEGITEHLSRLTTIARFSHKLDRVEFIELSTDGNENFNIGDYSVSTCSMLHQKESLGYIITSADGRSLALSGDTAWCDSLSEMIAVADATVMEMSEFKPTKDRHMFLHRDLDKVLKSVRPESKIFLTHLARSRELYQSEIESVARTFDDDLKSRLQNITILEEFKDYVI